MTVDIGRIGSADRVLSPSATEPLRVSSHPGNAPLRGTLPIGRGPKITLRIDYQHVARVMQRRRELGIGEEAA